MKTSITESMKYLCVNTKMLNLKASSLTNMKLKHTLHKLYYNDIPWWSSLLLCTYNFSSHIAMIIFYIILLLTKYICYQSVFSVTQSCPTLCDPMDCSTSGLSVHHQLPEFTQTHVHWVGDAFQPSHPLSSPSSPTFNLSQHQGLFKGVSSSHQVAKGLEFQLQHQSFQWTFRTDFFMMDWLDLLAIQGTLKSLLQHHSSKTSILQCSAFFIVQLSHSFITTEKNYSFD